MENMQNRKPKKITFLLKDECKILNWLISFEFFFTIKLGTFAFCFAQNQGWNKKKCKDMSDQFTTTDLNLLNESIFRLIGKDWMLIAAGNKKSYNMMTASWGGCGILWNKPVAFIFVRPQRYTLEFLEKHDHFTLNFFDPSYRKTLNLLGTKSGREINKMEVDGMKAIEINRDTIGFENASLILECKKVYADKLKPENFIDPSFLDHYPLRDYHIIYYGEIINALKKV